MCIYVGSVAQVIDPNSANNVMQYLEQTLRLTYEEGMQMLKVRSCTIFLHNLGLLFVYIIVAFIADVPEINLFGFHEY